jgi:hypothetical protein
VTYHRPRVLPDFAADAVKRLCFARVRAVRIAGRYSIDDRLGANPDHACHGRRKDDGYGRHARSHSGNARPFGVSHRAMASETHRRDKNHLGEYADHPAARERENRRHAHKHCGYPVHHPLFSADVARRNERHREWDEQFHVAGKVVPVKEGAERGGFGVAHPVNIGAAAKILHQPENSHDRAEEDEGLGQREQPDCAVQKVGGQD